MKSVYIALFSSLQGKDFNPLLCCEFMLIIHIHFKLCNENDEVKSLKTKMTQ